jgi:hypothetical protein
VEGAPELSAASHVIVDVTGTLAEALSLSLPPPYDEPTEAPVPAANYTKPFQ